MKTTTLIMTVMATLLLLSIPTLAQTGQQNNSPPHCHGTWPIQVDFDCVWYIIFYVDCLVKPYLGACLLVIE